MDHFRFGKEALVIDKHGHKVGQMSISDAKRAASDVGLDLVEVHRQGDVSVCKIMDEGKWKYEQKKKAQNNKVHQLPDKEIKFRLSIDSHDQETKIKHAKKFLQKGHRVKIAVQYRGREASNTEMIRNKMSDILGQLGDFKFDDPRKCKERKGERLETFVYPTVVEKQLEFDSEV